MSFLDQARAELRNINVEVRSLEERIRAVERIVYQLEDMQGQASDAQEELKARLSQLNTIVREEDGAEAGSLLGRLKNLERWRLDTNVLHNSRATWWGKLVFEVLKWAVLLALGGVVTWTLTKMGKP